MFNTRIDVYTYLYIFIYFYPLCKKKLLYLLLQDQLMYINTTIFFKMKIKKIQFTILLFTTFLHYYVT